MYRTKDQVAQEFITEGNRRGITPRGQVICIATGLVESNLTVYANSKVPESLTLPHDAVGSDGRSVGPLQQQVVMGANGWWWGDAATCMDPTRSAGLFYDRLARRAYDNGDPGAHAQAIQQSAYPDRYAQRMGEAQALYDRLTAGNPSTPGGTVGVSGDPVWLEEVLRPALGDRLKTLDGWQERGHGDFKDIRGVMVHHTGNRNASAASIRDGRPDLPGPLSNIHISTDGTVTIVAVGVCWHAGRGSYPWLPTDNGNWHLIGIECAHDGNEQWPDAQIIALRDTCAALALKLGTGSSHVIGHKEYAGAAQGKWDPGNMDMSWFRGEVQKDMDGFVFPGEHPPIDPAPGPIVPPDYGKETWDQLRIEWPQLGGRTLVNAVATIGAKLGIDGFVDIKDAK